MQSTEQSPATANPVADKSGERAMWALGEASAKLPHSEAAACNCAGDNPRAAPRYEGRLAGLTAPRDPSFNEANVSDKPASIRDLTLMNQTQINAVDARYRARAEAVLGVDDLVQNVVSTLQASGELKNTVLIFTSDNGFFHGEHRVRQGKVRVYEPSIRVPLIEPVCDALIGVWLQVSKSEIFELLFELPDAQPVRERREDLEGFLSDGAARLF